jgi:hypothetical protein
MTGNTRVKIVSVPDVKAAFGILEDIDEEH